MTDGKRQAFGYDCMGGVIRSNLSPMPPDPLITGDRLLLNYETIYNGAFHKYRSVLIIKPLIIIGLVIIILGVIFLLQSKSSLGPSTSFMYSNPDWTVNGYIIIAMGFIVIAVGVVTRQYSKKHS